MVIQVLGTFGGQSGRDGCFADWGPERSFDEMSDKMWSGVRGYDGEGHGFRFVGQVL